MTVSILDMETKGEMMPSMSHSIGMLAMSLWEGEISLLIGGGGGR
jgi:hypothetical protein